MCVNRQYKKDLINILNVFLIYTECPYDSYDFLKILVEGSNKLNKFV